MVSKVAYLINEYPAVSQTFIKREIQGLERRGVGIARFALRGWDTKLVDCDDHREREKTRYVLQAGLGPLALALIGCALSTPRRFLQAAALAWRMSRGSDTRLVVHGAYLAEACLLRRWLAEAGVTHLHAHFATNPAEVALLVHTLGGPRYSFTAHGSDIMDRPAQAALDHKVGGASFVAAVCSFGRNQIWRWVPFEMWGKVAVVYCGLPTGYGADAVQSSAFSNRLLCVGRLAKEKGQALLLEAAARLRDEGLSFEIVLVGDGPMRSAIEALIQQRSLGDHVRLAGSLDSQGVLAELGRARALVMSSLSEGLPIVIMEALACGRPVIAPYLAGIPELVIHGENGWLYPAGDVAALAGAMKTCLLASPDRLDGLGQQGRERVRARHDANAQAGKLLALINGAAGTTDSARV